MRRESHGRRKESLTLLPQRRNSITGRRSTYRPQRRRIHALAALALFTGLIVFFRSLYGSDRRAASTYIDETLDDPPADEARLDEWDAVWNRADRLMLPPELGEAMLLDTRPIRRPHRPTPDTRYLAYRSHSGFHNQRIALQNAIALAHLTNRTLLVPLARLGRPQPQVIGHEERLRRLEHEDKDGLLACARWLPELERRPVDLAPDQEEAPFIGPRGCLRYSGYTMIGWDMLGDLTEVSSLVDLVDRTNTSRAWFTDPSGLNLPPDSITNFDEFNTTIYNLRIHERSDEATPLQTYLKSITLDELNSSPLADQRLLSFGSLHGSTRLLARSSDYDMIAAAAERAMVFRHPLLLLAVDEVVRLLGGPNNYIGLHLRIGDGFFQRLGNVRMPEVYRRTLGEVFGFDEDQIDQLLLAAAERDAATPPWVPDARDRPPGLSTRLMCGHPLYTEPELVVLNAPIYIATDARSPRSHPDLQIFFRTFPCAFTLADFSSFGGSDFSTDHVETLVEIDGIRSAHDGVRLGKYLVAFVDAILAARSRVATIGCVTVIERSHARSTRSSTFSKFAERTLHPAYAREETIARNHADLL